ncbi:MAG: hypothetical protein U1E65_01950 [Myxococcota bacterium]
MADPSPSASPVEVFQWEDGQGVMHLVDALEKVPAELRAKAKKITFFDDRPSLQKELEQKIPPRVRQEVGQVATRVEKAVDLHWPSFGLGVGLAIGLVILWKVVWSGAKLILKLVVFAVIASLLGGGYFGVLRSGAGLGAARLSSPQELIDDAKQVVDQANKHTKDQEKALKEIEKR